MRVGTVVHAVLNTKLMEGFYLKRPSSAAAVLKHGYFVGTESSLHMCRHCVVCVSLHAGLDRVIVAVIDTGVELASSGVGAAVWANAAEVAGDGVDNDGNGAYAWAVVFFPLFTPGRVLDGGHTDTVT